MENRESGIGNRQERVCEAIARLAFPIPHSRFPIPGPKGAEHAIMLRYPDDGCAGAHLNVL